MMGQITPVLWSLIFTLHRRLFAAIRNLFSKKILQFSASNSRKLQAVICYVTLYNFHTPFGYYGPSKVKNQSIADLLKKVHQVRKKVYFSSWLKYPNRDK